MQRELFHGIKKNPAERFCFIGNAVFYETKKILSLHICRDRSTTPAVPPGLVSWGYPLSAYCHMPILITEYLLRLAYCMFSSPSEVHSAAFPVPRSHHPGLSETFPSAYYSSSTVFNNLPHIFSAVNSFFGFSQNILWKMADIKFAFHRAIL